MKAQQRQVNVKTYEYYVCTVYTRLLSVISKNRGMKPAYLDHPPTTLLLLLVSPNIIITHYTTYSHTIQSLQSGSQLCHPSIIHLRSLAAVEHTFQCWSDLGQCSWSLPVLGNLHDSARSWHGASDILRWHPVLWKGRNRNCGNYWNLIHEKSQLVTNKT